MSGDAPQDAPATGMIRTGTFNDSDAELVTAILSGHPRATEVFYRRYVSRVQSILLRVLGVDADFADIRSDVFVQAFQSMRTLRAGEALTSWLSSVTVFTAHNWIRRRQRQRWLRFLPASDLPELEAPLASMEIREACRATYRALDALAANDRLMFCMRVIRGMPMAEVARHCGLSLSTTKRRLARAQHRFRVAAKTHPALKEWLEGTGERHVHG